jgi:lipopolysaccharide export system protein LptA
MKTNTMTMSGGTGVLLTQGKNVLRADRLTVDLTTSVSRLECDPGKRCVQALISSTSDKQGGGIGGGIGGLNASPLGSPSSGNTAKPAPRSSEPMQISPR